MTHFVHAPAGFNNLRVCKVVFLGKDNQFDEQWLSLQQLASRQVAFGLLKQV